MNQKITIDGQMTGNINFAMQQNYVPVFRSLVVTNVTDTPLEKVTLRITFEPDFAREFETEIERLEPGAPIEISPVRIVLSAQYLFSLTERIAGSVHIGAFCGGEAIFSQDMTINLLAYDQWLGTMYMPEMTAAFITPNHPAVAAVTAKAGEYLCKWTGDPAFTAYQSRNPNIVKKQAAAIYAALQAENIGYIVHPASFETLGQRVRLPHSVLENKQGTCLDLALTYASCLEAVGLNPLIVFLRGHAFAGVWLENETFAECAEDDISALTKRTAAGIDEICLVECTAFTAGRNLDFDRAEKRACDKLLDPSEFDFVLDVARCRGSGIRPIPTQVSADGKFETADYGERKESDITGAPKEIDMSLHGAQSAEQSLTRQNIWERKLLDLSLRNSLLNFRPSAANIQFMTADLGRLEDEISRGEEFKIMPIPQDMTFSVSDSRIFEIENSADLVTAVAESEFSSRRIRTFLEPAELEVKLKKLHRSAKLSLEENGANTLYLALGFLRWFETDKSDRARYAPLVLIPVDLVRKLRDRSYSLRIRGEDAQMNVTLLEMLRQDFGINIGGLNPLPEDESGVDLPLVFNTVRQGVMSKRRWDIEEFAFLGQFSFSSFIMWNDIRSRSEELKKNKVVASLISGKPEWEPKNTELSPNELDEKISPSDMAVPTSADSSQLAAIYAAAQGESFVLHGPPGTGKSQTITNMIANALYNGKSVLFVAEKMAALSVVQKRLAAIGLDPFCLELHSNKTQKKAVLGQLERTLEVGRVKSPEDYERTAESLNAQRRELNAVMSALHEKRRIGMSLYEAIVGYDRNEKYKGTMNFNPAFADSLLPEEYSALCDAVRNVSACGRELGDFTSSPLKNYTKTEYSPEIRDRFAELCNSFCERIATERRNYSALCEAAGLECSPLYEDYLAVNETLRTAVKEPYFAEVMKTDTAENRRVEIDALLGDGKRYSELRAKLLQSYEESVLGLDPEKLKMDWKRNEQKWFLPKALGRGKLVKELALYAKTPGFVTKENYTERAEELCTLAKLKASITSADGEITALFGNMWRGETTDFAAAEKVLASSEMLRSRAVTAGLTDILVKMSDDGALKKKIAETADRLAQDFSDTEKTISELAGYADMSGILSADNWFDAADGAARGWIGSVSLIRARSALQNALKQLRRLSAREAADAYECGKVGAEDICAAFECEICRALIAAAFKKDQSLGSFSGAQFEAQIEKYRDTAKRFEQLTVQELSARLSAKIPDISAGGAGSSELAVLQKAIRSGGRMTPIRKLFDSIPNLLRRICPCMLMSPISVAQYIDPSFPKFDLVIFDEASQMPTCEAVGAIARGENVIVVGDPKQLPPTSFFTANQVDEENFDKEDLESVLDDCLALTMPSKHLLWHYRSRHESLIAFSNAKFYENKLLTFPSPDDLVSEVKWVNTGGFYDKGKTKQNRAEAEAVVAEIVRRLRDEKLRGESIGVVTFSVVQQNLIDDMLADELVKDPQLELYADSMYEPIIIKNLENVQGDERDVILFSVGYGPDKDGKVSMNFGPLNRDGGWRRLNVAVSRARRAMIVYSTLRPEQIDLSRTRSDGVAQLKAFLEFAAKGKQALAVGAASASVKAEGFAEEVAEALCGEGFDARCAIGCSGYKIDVGIVDPEDPDRYIMALMCEGRNLYDSTTARDRNILQPSVLKGLGWNVRSVHILDWLDDRQRVIEKLKADIAAAADERRENPDIVQNEPAAALSLDFEREEPADNGGECEIYSPWELSSMGGAEDYYAPENLKKIAENISCIVEAEAPVSRRYAEKKVIAAWGITRVGSRVDKVFDEAAAAAGVSVSESNGGVFYWNVGQLPENYSGFRVPASSADRRAMDDICAEEICGGVMKVLNSQIAMQRADLVRETAKLFGWSRLSAVIESSVNAGIECAVKRGLAVCGEDGKVTLAK